MSHFGPSLSCRLTRPSKGGESRINLAAVAPLRLSSQYTRSPSAQFPIFASPKSALALLALPQFPRIRSRILSQNAIAAVAAGARRSISMEALVLPPLYFTGLLAGLWAWKCLMMIVFQNKIIYMPGMPPNARMETISDYASKCGGIQWEEHRTRASDGIDLALCVASIHSGARAAELPHTQKIPVYILYLHGNASSLPPRLPDLSRVLRDVQSKSSTTKSANVRYTMVCLSYRGYWTSRGRPSEDGIMRDTMAAMSWISQLHGKFCSEQDVKDMHQAYLQPAPVIVWGASIGAGFATGLAANDKGCPGNLRIVSLCLETPFTSIRDMLVALYPQKWVPYKHLWPFLWNHLDSYENLQVLAENCRLSGRSCPSIFLLQAGKDQIVPAEHGDRLYARCVRLGLQVERYSVVGAFHNDATWRASGRQALAANIVNEAQRTIESHVSPPGRLGVTGS